MAWSMEDRLWLEQRLEQHHSDIQAQLERHFSKIAVDMEAGQIAVDMEAGQTGKGFQRLVAPLRRLPTRHRVATPLPSLPSRHNLVTPLPSLPTRQNNMVNKQQQQGTQDEEEKTETPARTTSLHHLVVDDSEFRPDPKSMRGMVILFLSTFMSNFINGCVFANTIIMFVELQWLGSIANASLGVGSHSEWPNAHIIWPVLDYIFTLIFLLDLVLQLYAYRLQYFRSKFNIIDSLVVVITSLETFVLTPLSASVGNVSVVRLLRLARLTRAFRAVRTFKSFESLRVLIAVFCFSFGSTFWSLVILFVFQIMASLFMCHSLHDFVVDPSNDPAMRAWVNSMYGDGVKSFWTIFELTFSGCWPNYARRIIEEVSPAYSLFYFFYVYVVVFVATRIVAALFMKETLTQYANDAEMMVRERAKKSSWIKQSLTSLFEEADSNHDGLLSEDELRALFSHPKVKLWMKELGVDASDTDALIQLLDEEDGWMVNSDDFVHGITRLKGEARSQDLAHAYNQVKRVLAHVKELRCSMDALVQEMGSLSRFDETTVPTASHTDLSNCPPPTEKTDCKAKYGGFIPRMWSSQDHCFAGTATVMPG